jgi:hypothetical protein
MLPVISEATAIRESILSELEDNSSVFRRPPEVCCLRQHPLLQKFTAVNRCSFRWGTVQTMNAATLAILN